MRRNYLIADTLLLAAIALAFVASLLWWLYPPMLTSGRGWLHAYDIAWPLTIIVLLVLTLALTAMVRSSSASVLTHGLVERPHRVWFVGVLLVAVAIRVLAVPRAPTVPPAMTDNDFERLQSVLDVGIKVGTPPPGPGGKIVPIPSGVPESPPTSMPQAIDQLKLTDVRNPPLKTSIDDMAAATQAASHDDDKLLNYLKQAAAAGAAAYALNAVPPPLNKLVARLVGKLVLSLLGARGDILPSQALFVGELVTAICTGDASTIQQMFQRSPLGQKAMEAIQSEVGKVLTKEIDDPMLRAFLQDLPATQLSGLQNGLGEFGKLLANTKGDFAKYLVDASGKPLDESVQELFQKYIPQAQIRQVLETTDPVARARLVFNALKNAPGLTPQQPIDALRGYVDHLHSFGEPVIGQLRSIYQEAFGVPL